MTGACINQIVPIPSFPSQLLSFRLLGPAGTSPQNENDWRGKRARGLETRSKHNKLGTVEVSFGFISVGETKDMFPSTVVELLPALIVKCFYHANIQLES